MKIPKILNKQKKKNENQEDIIPTYQLTKPKRKIPKWIVVSSAVILIIFSTIYLPPMLLEEPDTTTRASIDLSPNANANAMEWAYGYLRNNPEADFDNDGLTNEVELDYGTGIYILDNDDDGVTDFAELYLLGTNPCILDDGIIKFVKQADVKTGNAVNTPFKLHNIILWADDYESKARGGVIALSDGSYNFYRFQGWVQFPTTVEAAYKVENNIQVPLKKNENGYFYIDSPALTNVRIYEKQPEKCHIISFIGNKYSLPDNFATKTLSFILPSKGFGLVTCRPALKNDIDGTWDEKAVSNKISTLKLTDYSEDRFGHDQRNLSDLAEIFAQIDRGNNVLISLMSHEVGENIVEVYGYTNRNNLLVCDPQTGEDFGVINIDVIGERILGQSGSIENYEHFTFQGCGYSSAARHRIMLLDTITSTKDSVE